MPCYEVKYYDKSQWEKISESALLNSLQETYDQIAPVIQEMIEGKKIETPDAVYRIKGYDYPYL
jgi:hypothetical protein